MFLLIWQIARKEILLAIRSKGFVFFLFIMPILFIVLFASIFAERRDAFNLPLVNLAGSAGTPLIQQLQSIKGLNVQLKTNEATAIAALKHGDTTALLVIPADFKPQQNSELRLYLDANAGFATLPYQTILQQVSQHAAEGKTAAVLTQLTHDPALAKQLATPPLTVKEIAVSATKINSVAQYVPGFTVMNVFFIMIVMLNRFLDDKNNGILARLLSTPLHPFPYLIGMWLPNVLIVIIQCLTLLTFGRVVYHLPLGDPLALAAVILCLAMCATGLGLLLALTAKSFQTGNGIVQLLATGGAALAGLWFPFDLMPDFMQHIGRLTPQYWAHQGFLNVLVRGAHLSDIWQNLLILCGFGVVSILLSVWRYPRHLRAAVMG